ncbi:hypothetical protein HK414_08305 [Ramlibacter terrae]|uniref:Glycosyltransferase RgtA/B/C/D-like domain-containing protein n=1 Tax=Ramlibacter terrae TaxID=2732511 RepID=A0ABX6P2X9_9BURK|nr:hypothetical protein HK414_08305 [Ramlibacter terrae]
MYIPPIPFPPDSIRPVPARVSGLVIGVVFLLFVGVWFGSPGIRSLIHSDEGRYAALALEMARSGDWITPRLNGFLYFEKPAFQYWMGALSFRAFGISEFSARLWPGVAGFLTVASVGYTAHRLWGAESGLRALAICGSTTDRRQQPLPDARRRADAVPDARAVCRAAGRMQRCRPIGSPPLDLGRMGRHGRRCAEQGAGGRRHSRLRPSAGECPAS